MANLQDITINVTRNTKALQTQGFGVPLILTEGGPYYWLDVGSGTSGLRFLAKTRGAQYINVVVADPDQTATAGSQSWGFSSSTSGASASGLTNDSTTYTASVNVDGTPRAVSIVGSASQTITTVINEINADLSGYATASFVATGNGSIKITSDTTGDDSSIAITDTDLFSSLTNANVAASTAVPGDSDTTALTAVRSGSGTSGSPYVITVTLDTDEDATILSTANDVKRAIEADSNCNAIVQVQLLGANGNGVMAAFSSASLAAPSDLYRTYTQNADVIGEGFTTNDAEYKMCAAMFAQTPSPKAIKVYSRPTGADISDTLANLILTHNDWYALFISDRTKASIVDASVFAFENKKLGIFCSSDFTVMDEALAQNDRTALMLHDAPTTYPECAWAGGLLPTNPGSVTWKWKKPSGVSAPSYTATQLTQIREGNAQTIENRGGILFVDEGKTLGGEFIDVVRGLDWQENDMNDELFLLLTGNPKIAMDDVGISQIETGIRSSLDRGGARGIWARAVSEADMEKSDNKVYMYTVVVPLRSELSTADKLARNLTGISWTAYLAGAVHTVTINGLVTV